MPFNKSSSSSDQLKELDTEEAEQPKSKKWKKDKSGKDNKTKDDLENPQKKELPGAKSRKQKVDEEEGQTPKVAKVSNGATKEASSGVVKTRPTRSNPSGKIIEKPQTPAEPKAETPTEPKPQPPEPKPESSQGYQMPQSLSEKIIDSWFDQHYVHSFSGFLKV